MISKNVLVFVGYYGYCTICSNRYEDHNAKNHYACPGTFYDIHNVHFLKLASVMYIKQKRLIS